MLARNDETPRKRSYTLVSSWGRRFDISPEIVTPAYVDELLSRIAPDFKGQLLVADEDEDHGFLHSALVVRDALCAIGQLYEVYDDEAGDGSFEACDRWLSSYPKFYERIGGRGGALTCWEAGSRDYSEHDFIVGTLWKAKPVRTKEPGAETDWQRKLREEDEREPIRAGAWPARCSDRPRRRLRRALARLG
jgi:hypothetical protein